MSDVWFPVDMDTKMNPHLRAIVNQIPKESRILANTEQRLYMLRIRLAEIRLRLGVL